MRFYTTPNTMPEQAHPVTDRLGRPLRDLRVSVTDECNFRCTYCMPEVLFGEGHPFLPPGQLLSFGEITRIVQAAASLGVRKVKITGGEPLLRPGLHRLIASLTHIPGIEDVGLITNGFHLPSLGTKLREAGLSRITLSLDTLSPETSARLRFVEYMDVGRRNRFEPGLLVPKSEIRDRLHERFGLEPEEDAYFAEVADTYRCLFSGGFCALRNAVQQLRL
ncbi:MAG: radical SAM protein [Spirochaetaceae bacterium]